MEVLRLRRGGVASGQVGPGRRLRRAGGGRDVRVVAREHVAGQRARLEQRGVVHERVVVRLLLRLLLLLAGQEHAGHGQVARVVLQGQSRAELAEPPCGVVVVVRPAELELLLERAAQHAVLLGRRLEALLRRGGRGRRQRRARRTSWAFVRGRVGARPRCSAALRCLTSSAPSRAAAVVPFGGPLLRSPKNEYCPASNACSTVCVDHDLLASCSALGACS